MWVAWGLSGYLDPSEAWVHCLQWGFWCPHSYHPWLNWGMCSCSQCSSLEYSPYLALLYGMGLYISDAEKPYILKMEIGNQFIKNLEQRLCVEDYRSAKSLVGVYMTSFSTILSTIYQQTLTPGGILMWRGWIGDTRTLITYSRPCWLYSKAYHFKDGLRLCI